jgi:glycosyltransferase involved in cell wall biosynthesis
MKELLAKRSLLLHLVMLRLGVNAFPNLSETNPEAPSQRPPVSNAKERKILIVGMSESPHLYTWIEGIADSGIADKVWLFPSDLPLGKLKSSKIKVIEFPYIFIGIPTKLIFRILDLITNRLWRSYFLLREINRIRPTHLHFHETQHGAYIYNPIAKHPKNKFVGTIILSTWGSDLIAFGKIESHLPKIQQVMSWVNLLTSERKEDEQIALTNGFSGRFLAPIYITIGRKNLDCDFKKTSDRSSVIVKGYQDTHGRALNALASIELLAEEIDISKFTFKVFSASKPVKQRSKIMRKELGIDIEILPRMPKSILMRHFAESRVYLGLAMSDGLSTSMVEAMSYGAFPIQSENSAAPEFLINEFTGGVVDPLNIREITNLLRIALQNNELVDQAASLNVERLQAKYNWDIGLKRLAEVYE